MKCNNGSNAKFRKILTKTSVVRPIFTRSCSYLGVRNVSFSEHFAYVLNERPPTPHEWIYSYSASDISIIRYTKQNLQSLQR